MPPVHPRRSTASVSFATALALSLGALLPGCGGGGSDSAAQVVAAATSAARPTLDATTQHAANATSAGRHAVHLLDGSVRTARALLAAQAAAAAAAPPSAHALAAAAAAGSSPALTIPCPSGGSASVTLPGSPAGGPATLPWAAGADYDFDLSACRVDAARAPLSGGFTLHVFTATDSDASVSLTLRALSLGGTDATLTLTGSASVQVTQADGADGSRTQTLRISSPSLTLVTLAANGDRGEFALTGAAFFEESRSVAGVPASTRMNGAHQLAVSLPIGSFSYSVATLGDVVSSAAGVPQSGGWRFGFAGMRVDVTVIAATVQIAVDLDGNGSPEFSFSLPASALFGSAS